ncbi:MAG TPA: 23S rRNA (uracil(1939)-C(5))-methyltransferase RlmD, partial [Bacteroidetes bacterium]|nr:23S rRNA (uracil(1939)-C(5))-methyltransferase RlmD [Bacteroidota bacterium]
TGETMVNIVTFDHNAPLLQRLARALLEQLPELTGVVNNVTKSKGGSAFGEEEYLLAGKPVIREKIGDHVFEISANSFFQTNPGQAERLYQKALQFAGLTGEEIVYDLYAGTGTISLFLSDYTRCVVGVEVIESAVKDARNNAEKNGVNNCTFVLSDVRDEFREIKTITNNYGQPDVLVLDPPRAGVHPKSLQGILELQPERIIYISCNPATFARDAQVLCQNKYKLQQVQPVDMFPHTYHVELIAKLERR